MSTVQVISQIDPGRQIQWSQPTMKEDISKYINLYRTTYDIEMYET